MVVGEKFLEGGLKVVVVVGDLAGKRGEPEASKESPVGRVGVVRKA